MINTVIISRQIVHFIKHLPRQRNYRIDKIVITSLYVDSHNHFGPMTFATQSVVYAIPDRYRSIALDCEFFFFTLLPARGLLPRQLCSQSGSSRDPSPAGCVTVRSTTMVVRVSGSRKPLFKFANYLMIGQTRTRPLQFSTDQLVSDRICVPLRTGQEREMSSFAQTMSSHFDRTRRQYFLATTNIRKKKKKKQLLSKRVIQSSKHRAAS